MCLYPKLIKNKKYTANKKNRGIIPPISDERVLWVPVGCEKCIECRKQKARGWQVRLLEDIKTNKNGKFIALTFSNESIAKLATHKSNEGLAGYYLDNGIAKLGVRMWLERWRKKHGKSLRHWLVTELGHEGTENIHLHGIVWTDETINEVASHWKYGYVWTGKGEKKINYVNAKTINYTIKYVHKIDEKHPGFKSKVLTTAGIGANYVKTMDWKRNRYNGINTIETYRTDSGFRIAMPVYWRNKTYDEQEREKLWLQKLDKNERWVCGERVAADNHEEYYELLKWHRKRNKRLGYGDDEKNWEQLLYENKRRQLLTEKRIAKAKAIANKA